jgi:hypothetical protein
MSAPVEHISGRNGMPPGGDEPRHLHPVRFTGRGDSGWMAATCAGCPEWAAAVEGVHEAGELLLRVTLPHSGLEDSPQAAVIRQALAELADLGLPGTGGGTA